MKFVVVALATMMVLFALYQFVPTIKDQSFSIFDFEVRWVWVILFGVFFLFYQSV